MCSCDLIYLSWLALTNNLLTQQTKSISSQWYRYLDEHIYVMFYLRLSSGPTGIKDGNEISENDIYVYTFNVRGQMSENWVLTFEVRGQITENWVLTFNVRGQILGIWNLEFITSDWVQYWPDIEVILD